MKNDFLKAIRENLRGHKQKTVCEATGVPQASLSRFMAEKQSGLDLENVLALVDYLGLELTTPGQSMIRGLGPKSPVEPVAQTDETQTVNVYTVAGAGPGVEISELEPLFSVSGPPEYFKRSNFAVKVWGHSMEPLIPNDAVVGVRVDVAFQANEIYLAHIPYEGLVIKRVGVDRQTNEYIFKSANPDKEAYPDFRISITEAEKIIVGRVVWVMQGY